MASWAVAGIDPAEYWDREFLSNIWLCVVILHNMIIEDKLKDGDQMQACDDELKEAELSGSFEFSRNPPPESFKELLARILRVSTTGHLTRYDRLLGDMIQHTWDAYERRRVEVVVSL